jgi:hypothetical protein
MTAVDRAAVDRIAAIKAWVSSVAAGEGDIIREDSIIYIADFQALDTRTPNVAVVLGNMDARRELVARRDAMHGQLDLATRVASVEAWLRRPLTARGIPAPGEAAQ